MAQAGQCKCLCCRQFFVADRRNRKRQRYCSTAPCRRASKTASQAAWLLKPQNRTYFRDPSHVQRVKQWRAVNPGYARGRGRTGVALQDPLITQVVEPTQESSDRAALPLQDRWGVATPILAGLIAHLFELTLQEDMAATARHLVQLGQDVINQRPSDEHQTRAVPRAPAPSASAVQLG